MAQRISAKPVKERTVPRYFLLKRVWPTSLTPSTTRRRRLDPEQPRWPAEGLMHSVPPWTHDCRAKQAFGTAQQTCYDFRTTTRTTPHNACFKPSNLHPLNSSLSASELYKVFPGLCHIKSPILHHQNTTYLFPQGIYHISKFTYICITIEGIITIN